MDARELGLKVGIVGSGQVGATFAYALLMRGLATEIVIVDLNRSLAEGNAEDLNHGLPFVRPAVIRAGEYGDLEGADIIVITAGAAQKKGETRLDLTKRNVEIFSAMIPSITKYNKSGILIVVSNPVDVLTYATIAFSGFETGRVIGTGTALDSARFRFLLSRHCGIDPRNVHAYVIGEHGDSEIGVWSLVHLSGVKLDEYCRFCAVQCGVIDREKIITDVRTAAYSVIEKKGATCYAVGLATLTLVESIVRDQNTIMTVSGLLNNYLGISGVSLSVPAVLNRKGISTVIELPLTEEELAALRRSAEVLREQIVNAGLP